MTEPELRKTVLETLSDIAPEADPAAAMRRIRRTAGRGPRNGGKTVDGRCADPKGNANRGGRKRFPQGEQHRSPSVRARRKPQGGSRSPS